MTQANDGSFKEVVPQIIRIGHLLIFKKHPKLVINLSVTKTAASDDELLYGGRVKLLVVLGVAFVVDAQAEVLYQLLSKDSRQVLCVDHHALLCCGDASVC